MDISVVESLRTYTKKIGGAIIKEKRWLIFVLTALSGGIATFGVNAFVLLSATEIVSASLSVTASSSAAVIIFLVIIALAGVRLLVSLTVTSKTHGRVPGMITAILPCVCALIAVRETALPLACVCLADFLQEIIAGYRRIPLLLILTAVLAAVLYAYPSTVLSVVLPEPPSMGLFVSLPIILIGFSFAGVCLYTFDLLDRRARDFKTLIERSERIAELERRLGGQRRAAQSLEYTAKIAERNRLAMRLHDEVGHGISGSILLLEGAAAVMDSDVQTAKDTIILATENLRTSADEIRRVLREEYADRADAGLSRLKNELAHFGAEHPHIKTELTIGAGTDELSAHLWACICENMTEALTNTLKHSNADLFRVEIANKNKLLRVEFSDNGKQRRAANHEKVPDTSGIGLAGIEERCALCYGRCFFEKKEDGFFITMTFPLRRAF
jgi:signal transduction histidine kinase